MKIHFDQQDLINSVAVYIAFKKNGDCFEDIDPDLVSNIAINHNNHVGFTAEGYLYGYYYLNEQELIDAVATYLSGYHSFEVDLLIIELNYDGVFTAEIVVER